MGCIISTNEKYLEVFNLPKSNNKIDIQKYDFIEPLTDNIAENCEKLREKYTSYNKDDKLNNLPIKIIFNRQLLGKLINIYPYGKYFEGYKKPNEFIIKLNSESKYDELNILSSILREKFDFKNVILCFHINLKTDTFELSHIYHKNELIDDDDLIWTSLVQSAFTELTLILLIENIILDLQLTNHTLTNIVPDNFLQKLNLKRLLFDTDILFKQVLSSNIKFKKYIIDFNIDKVIDNYLNLSDFSKIRNFSNLIWINQNNKTMQILKNFKDNKKILELNFLINITDFNFIKNIFTDAFDNTKLNNKSLEILMKII